MASVQQIFNELGLALIERGWLSSNNVVFAACGSVPATVVDTGYRSHSEQTLALVSETLGPTPLQRIVNTHLHSDHCGGNAGLAQAFGAEVWVPEPSVDAARRWDTELLTFHETGQSCDRFPIAGALCSGATLELGRATWRVIGAGGHDPDAVMLFEPNSGVLITADALWESRLAIMFPEIDGDPGFQPARSSLDAIERLQPSVVIPGHGSAFTDVRRALEISRTRLAQFEANPERHFRYAVRALTMFHMLEFRRVPLAELLAWLVATPIFVRLYGRLRAEHATMADFAGDVIRQLTADGILAAEADDVIAVA